MNSKNYNTFFTNFHSLGPPGVWIIQKIIKNKKQNRIHKYIKIEWRRGQQGDKDTKNAEKSSLTIE